MKLIVIARRALGLRWHHRSCRKQRRYAGAGRQATLAYFDDVNRRSFPTTFVLAQEHLRNPDPPTTKRLTPLNLFSISQMVDDLIDAKIRVRRSNLMLTNILVT